MNAPLGTVCTLAAGNLPKGVLTVGIASTTAAADILEEERQDVSRPRTRRET